MTSSNQQRVAVRRVLRLVDRVLGKQKPNVLVTDGRGLMTWSDLRWHVRSALTLELLRSPRKANR